MATNNLKELLLAPELNIFSSSWTQKPVPFVLQIHMKDFSNISHDDWALEVNKGNNSKYFFKKLFWPKMGYFILKWAQSLVHLLLGIHPKVLFKFCTVIGNLKILFWPQNGTHPKLGLKPRTPCFWNLL